MLCCLGLPSAGAVGIQHACHWPARLPGGVLSLCQVLWPASLDLAAPKSPHHREGEPLNLAALPCAPAVTLASLLLGSPDGHCHEPSCPFHVQCSSSELLQVHSVVFLGFEFFPCVPWSGFLCNVCLSGLVGFLTARRMSLVTFS